MPGQRTLHRLSQLGERRPRGNVIVHCFRDRLLRRRAHLDKLVVGRRAQGLDHVAIHAREIGLDVHILPGLLDLFRDRGEALHALPYGLAIRLFKKLCEVRVHSLRLLEVCFRPEELAVRGLESLEAVYDPSLELAQGRS